MTDPEHLDVLIVGAGLSGIGAACRLLSDCPGTSFAILEARDALGGTWDLFRYPGVRSDSDMFTLSYPFRPWTGEKSIAAGSEILDYLRRTADERGVTEHIRFQRQVVSAEWSSADARWTVTAVRADIGQTERLTCSWLLACAGYYRYDEGFRPDFDGQDDFAGVIVHPQHWPDELDYTNKEVVVIGSGATTVSLVPTLTENAARVTIVQRTPSYILSLPERDPVAVSLRKRLSPRAVYPIVWTKNLLIGTVLYQFSRRRPAAMRELVRKGQVKLLPADYDIDTHFTPPYEPWDQRLCLAPDGDLFRCLHSGRASVVTGTIRRFTRTGVQLASGVEVPADIIVTATGLNVQPIGGISLAVDGVAVNAAETVIHKGCMLTGVPNFAMVFGYTNGSWTLKADLINRYICRLLKLMTARGYAVVTPVAPPDGHAAPFLDLTSGYVQRSLASLPKQGSRPPWRLHQNYFQDLRLFRLRPIEDEGLSFRRAG